MSDKVKHTESFSVCLPKKEGRCDTSKQEEDVKTSFLCETVKTDGKTTYDKDDRLLPVLLFRLLELHVKHRWKEIIGLCVIAVVGVILVFVLVHGNRSAVINKGPIPNTIYTVKEGGNVYVECKHQEQNKVKIWWTRNVPGSTFSQPKNLNITNVLRGQAGEYLCHIRDENGAATVEKVTVDVQYPCDVVFFSIDPQQMNENDTWRMECNVTGNPTPSVYILNNDTGVPVAQPTKALSFSISNKARCWDTGLYVCAGSNDLNVVSASKRQRMEVLCAPRPDYRYGSSDTQKYTAHVRDDLNITLYYLAYPYPKITWTHQGYDITPEKRRDIELRDTLATTLMLKNLQYGDFGDYVIDVVNTQGSSQTVVQIFGKGPPKPPTNLQVNGLYDYVVVRWYSGFDNFLKQTFLLKYRKDSDGSEWSEVIHVPDLTNQHWNASVAYLLRGLEIGSLYHFTVSARNDHGQESNTSNTVAFWTYVPKPNTIIVLEGKPLNVKCNNTIMPEADTWWTWNVTESAFFTNGSTLFLQNTRRLQAGRYLCFARVETTAKNGPISTDLIVDMITVDVQYPCDIVSFSISSDRVNENEPWSLQCKVMGNPDPTFTIRNNDTGSIIKEGTTTLNFTTSFDHARCLDNGLYVCTGYNTLNIANATKSLVLEVVCSPRPDHRYPIPSNVSYAARVGDDLTITFHFLAFPAPQITWSHPGHYKTPGQKDDKNVRGAHTTTLMLKGIQPDEFGQYIVEVRNSQGSALPLFAFISGKEGPPEEPTNLQVVGGSYNYIALEWYSGFDYFRKQIFLVKYKKVTGFSTWSTVEVPDNANQHNMGSVAHTLTGLQSNTYYIIAVSARNEYGQESAASTTYYNTRAKPHTSGSERHTSSFVIAVAFLQTISYLYFFR